MTNYIDWPGQSGRLYRYFVVDLTQPIRAVPANYTFVRIDLESATAPLYFGETDDADDRLVPSHEKWAQAVALGMTHVMGHATQGGVLMRRAEEQDLIARWQPPLNIEYRKAR